MHVGSDEPLLARTACSGMPRLSILGETRCAHLRSMAFSSAGVLHSAIGPQLPTDRIVLFSSLVKPKSGQAPLLATYTSNASDTKQSERYE